MSINKNISFIFYDEISIIKFPDTYFKLLEIMSFKFQTSIEECRKNIIIYYKDNEGDNILIDNNEDFNEFYRYSIYKKDIYMYGCINEKSINKNSKINENNDEKMNDILDNIPYTESVIIQSQNQEENIIDKIVSFLGLNKLKNIFS